MVSKGLKVKLAVDGPIVNGNKTASVAHTMMTGSRDHDHNLRIVKASSLVAWHVKTPSPEGRAESLGKIIKHVSSIA